MNGSRPDRLRDVRAFVPVHARWRLADQGAIPSARHQDQIDAAAVCIEVNGWTALVRRACADPTIVVETAQRIESATAQLVSAVASEGGDIIHLCAGRIVALWRDETWALAVARATSGALSALEKLGEASHTAGTKLVGRATVSAGEVALNTVGGAGDHWLCAITGAPIAELVDPAQRARDGEVLLRASAAAHIGDIVRGDPLPGGALRVVELAPRPRREALHGPTMVGGEARSLLRFVHPLVARALDDGRLPEPIARESTVVAVRLIDLRPDTDVGALQRVVADLQRQAQRLGGTVLRVRIEADGAYLAAEFDGPHRDETTAMAVLAARAMLGVPGLKSRCNAAVATGPAMRLVVGSRSRRALTQLGGLLRRAIAMTRHDDGLVVDAATEGAASTWLRFERRPDMQMGGLFERFETHRLLGRKTPPTADLPLPPEPATADAIAAMLADVADRNGRFSAFAVEEGAELDVTAQLRAALEAGGAEFVSSYCVFADRFAPFGAWRRLYRTWIVESETGSQYAELATRDGPATHDGPALTAWWLGRLRMRCELRPLVVVFTNGLAMDSASWQLARGLTSWLDGLQIIVTGPADSPDRPRRWLTEASDINEASDRWRGIAAAGHPHAGPPEKWPEMADKALIAGAHIEALELLRAAVDRFERAGHRSELADASLRLADALETLGRPDESLAVCQAALDALGRNVMSGQSTPRRLLRITDRITKMSGNEHTRREEALAARLQQRIAASHDLPQPSRGRR